MTNNNTQFNSEAIKAATAALPVCENPNCNYKNQAHHSFQNGYCAVHRHAGCPFTCNDHDFRKVRGSEF